MDNDLSHHCCSVVRFCVCFSLFFQNMKTKTQNTQFSSGNQHFVMSQEEELTALF